jgi:hypothetical protein
MKLPFHRPVKDDLAKVVTLAKLRSNVYLSVAITGDATRNDARLVDSTSCHEAGLNGKAAIVKTRVCKVAGAPELWTSVQELLGLRKSVLGRLNIMVFY